MTESNPEGFRNRSHQILACRIHNKKTLRPISTLSSNACLVWHRPNRNTRKATFGPTREGYMEVRRTRMTRDVGISDNWTSVVISSLHPCVPLHVSSLLDQLLPFFGLVLYGCCFEMDALHSICLTVKDLARWTVHDRPHGRFIRSHS